MSLQIIHIDRYDNPSDAIRNVTHASKDAKVHMIDRKHPLFNRFGDKGVVCGMCGEVHSMAANVRTSSLSCYEKWLGQKLSEGGSPQQTAILQIAEELKTSATVVLVITDWNVGALPVKIVLRDRDSLATHIKSTGMVIASVVRNTTGSQTLSSVLTTAEINKLL